MILFYNTVTEQQPMIYSGLDKDVMRAFYQRCVSYLQFYWILVSGT